MELRFKVAYSLAVDHEVPDYATIEEVAEQYGVSVNDAYYEMVSHIVSGDTWGKLYLVEQNTAQKYYWTTEVFDNKYTAGGWDFELNISEVER